MHVFVRTDPIHLKFGVLETLRDHVVPELEPRTLVASKPDTALSPTQALVLQDEAEPRLLDIRADKRVEMRQ